MDSALWDKHCAHAANDAHPARADGGPDLIPMEQKRRESMRVRAHIVRAMALTVVLVGGLALVTVPSASAAPATTCYGSAKSYVSSGRDNLDWPGKGVATTTSYCADINVKPSQGTYVQTCFWTNSDWTCNSYRWISAGTWGTAATDVLDGSQFFLHFDRSSSGLVAY